MGKRKVFGIRRGDRVALLVANRTEWIVAAVGAAKIGAVVAALSTFSTPRELAWALVRRKDGKEHRRLTQGDTKGSHSEPGAKL